MKMPYIRPDLTPEEAKKLRVVASQINSCLSSKQRFQIIETMLAENARLLKEVNDHRKTLGLDVLPGFNPKGMQ